MEKKMENPSKIMIGLAMVTSIVGVLAPKMQTKVRFQTPQTFCDVNRFTGDKREFTITQWDESTKWDVIDGIDEGSTIPTSCDKIKMQPNTYCLPAPDDKLCRQEYDVINLDDSSETDGDNEIGDIAEGGQE